MDFKDYYATLGVAPTATRDVIKRAYRKLARKYHPDVSAEPDAESRFKEVAEAHEALIDPERRAAYDDLVRRRRQGPAADPMKGGDPGDGDAYAFTGRGGDGGVDPEAFSHFFESIFGAAGGATRRAGARRRATGDGAGRGSDQHARIEIDLEDAYRGASRTVVLHHPVQAEDGTVTVQQREVEIRIPKGVRADQHLRLAGLGDPGHGGAPAGDLYLQVALRPHPRFRVEGADVWVDLPVAPWEAALGATLHAPTPEGDVELTVPPGSTRGRTLRLKGRGLPGQPPGDLYAVLKIAMPPSDTPAAREAYAAMARAFPDHHPRNAINP